MKCLAINTATKLLSIAVIDGDKVLYLHEKPEMRGQGNVLVGYIKSGLEQNSMDFFDLDLLAVVTGPGSFTGIRVGIAAMRGIAMAADKPLVGISSFEMFSVLEPEAINIVAVESWRNELYFSVFDENGKELLEPMNETPEVFFGRFNDADLADKKIIISGDAGEALKEFFDEAVFVDKEANAVDVVAKAIEKFGNDADIEKAVPYYLREADVTISSKVQKRVI